MDSHYRITALLAGTLGLGSCTALSTGLLGSPPGVNRYSFRECLLDDGFFTPTALAGVARQDYLDRHAQDITPARTRAGYLQMGELRFIGVTATSFYEGLLPHQQFGGEADPNRAVSPPKPAINHGVINYVGDRPYSENTLGHALING